MAAFNGAGQNNPQDDKSLLYATRVVYDPLGEYKLIEAPLDDAPTRISCTSASPIAFGEVPRGFVDRSASSRIANNETALGFEAAWKYKRFYAMLEYFLQTDAQENPTVGPDIHANGFDTQFGVFVVPKTQEHRAPLRADRAGRGRGRRQADRRCGSSTATTGRCTT